MVWSLNEIKWENSKANATRVRIFACDLCYAYLTTRKGPFRMEKYKRDLV